MGLQGAKIQTIGKSFPLKVPRVFKSSFFIIFSDLFTAKRVSIRGNFVPTSKEIYSRPLMDFESDGRLSPAKVQEQPFLIYSSYKSPVVD